MENSSFSLFQSAIEKSFAQNRGDRHEDRELIPFAAASPNTPPCPVVLSKYQIGSLKGSCRSGGDWGGSLNHLVDRGEWKAICGAGPSGRSIGWDFSTTKFGNAELVVTCPRCLKKAARLKLQVSAAALERDPKKRAI